MQNLKIKIQNFKFLIVILHFAFLIFNFIGCVSVPTRESFPIYNINGVSYVPLKDLCDLRGISWEYDSFARTIILSRNEHKIDLMVGEALVLVDGNPLHLKNAVDIYQGVVVVPYKFKEQVLDDLFKEISPRQKAPVYLTKIKRVVIDAGHGGVDPGAIGRTGLREKDVTLDIAKRLTRLLKAEGIEVINTRTIDKTVSLESRVDIANRSRADLFLSIHANANRVRSLNGFEVYYVSPSADDSKRALAAARNATLDLDSACFADSSLNLKAILWDMIYTNSRAESIELARFLCKATDRNSDTRIIGVKAARFYVLKGVRTPAVLIEVGFLSNYNEEKMLKNNYFRQKIAENIAEGLNDYSRELALAEARR